MHVRVVLSLLIAAGAASALLAQEPAPAGAPRAASDPGVAAIGSPVGRDPFRGPAVLEGARGPAPASGAALPRVAAGPSLRLLGVLRVAGRAPGALLEVEGRVCVVREGDALTVERGGEALTLRVSAIGASSLQVLVNEQAREVR